MIKKKQFLIKSSDDKKIEILLNIKKKKNIVIICHPHPLYGGSMHHKVVTMIQRGFQKNDISSILFNFPGVGKSTGNYTAGKKEKEYLFSVIEWTKKYIDYQNLLLAGFSFGSFIASHGALKKYNIKKIFLFAPPVKKFSFNKNINSNICIIQGKKDKITSFNDSFIWFNNIILKKKYKKQFFSLNTCHFFHKNMEEIINIIVNNTNNIK